MTKKELQAMITQAIRESIVKEIKPLIKKTIQREFYKIIDEAEQAQPQQLQQLEDDDLSMSHLLENKEEDATRQAVGQKIFGKQYGGQFADILNQTAQQYSGRPGISNDTGTVNEQKEFVFKTDDVNTAPGNPATQGNALKNMSADMLGYGDGFKKVGADANIPGVAPKKPSIKNMIKPTRRNENQPVKVSLPTTGPDGRPINFDKVPGTIVQNMMKNYSGLLKKVDAKVDAKRGK